jgi:hypothetical protein
MSRNRARSVLVFALGLLFALRLRPLAIATLDARE